MCLIGGAHDDRLDSDERPVRALRMGHGGVARCGHCLGAISEVFSEGTAMVAAAAEGPTGLRGEAEKAGLVRRLLWLWRPGKRIKAEITDLKVRLADEMSAVDKEMRKLERRIAKGTKESTR